jgi:regulator of protease activity HflC (stomatin/prohibitin superfamily)
VRDFLKTHQLGIVIGTLVVLFTIAYLAPDLFVFIHSGQAGVVWRRFGGGTDVDHVYGEGIKIKLPWDIFYVYDVRLQRADVDLAVLSRDGLRIDIATSVRYHPVLPWLGRLHKRAGPDYLHTILIPELSAVIGEVVARYRPEDLYSLRRPVIQEAITRDMLLAGRERWIAVDDVVIRSIRLPEPIQRAIQSKLEQEQLSLEYDYRLLKERKEAERKILEARGIRDFQQIVTGGISDRYLRWKGIDATVELARSPNAKVIVVGGRDGLPLILGGLPIADETPLRGQGGAPGSVRPPG